LVKADVQNPFLESVQTIAELTGVSSSKRSLEEILPDAARDFDAFYQQRSVATAAGAILVAAVDAKGIPMVKPCGAQPKARLTKGQKASKKSLATVATVFTRAPWVRTLQQVIESLFPTSHPSSSEDPPPPGSENKRLWASLLKGKTAVIPEVAEEMGRRDPLRSMTRLALTDGERALQIRVDQKLNVTLILDLIHVLEKLWKAAYCFHAEGSLEADLWVIDRTLRILFGAVGQVVKGIRQSITKGGLSGSQTQNPERGRQLPVSQPQPPCGPTNTSPTAGRLPAAPSKAPARTSSKIAWKDPACGGLSKWPKPSSNSEPSIGQGILIATGNSTSNRTSAGYTRQDRRSKATPKAGLTFTFDVCEGALPPWPAASIAPSGAHRRLSTRKPTETPSFLIGVWPRDKRMEFGCPIRQYGAIYRLLRSPIRSGQPLRYLAQSSIRWSCAIPDLTVILPPSFVRAPPHRCSAAKSL
jgi:hypothetical protein